MTDRCKIDDAITAWRDGATFNAVHPLESREVPAFLYDPDVVKDLARVIAASLDVRPLTYRKLP